MKMGSLEELFVDQLRDVYDAEDRLVNALPTLAKSASSPELKAAFERHLEETRQQVKRLEGVFKNLELKVKGKKCYAMKGLIEEGEELIDERPAQEVLDAGLIAAAQKVEHYEIACYGTLCTWAEQLGHHAALELLRQNLAEEKADDEKLTRLAEARINRAAQQPVGTA
jgi:ferritin-like metal-binding protein YciE